MWTGSIITVITVFIGIGAIAVDAQSVSISNVRLVSSRGGSCVRDGGINRCSVIRGETATFQGVLVVNGGRSYVGLDSLLVTLEWTRENLGQVVNNVKTCQRVGGDVVIRGDCDVTSIPEGSFNIVPFRFTIPNVDNSIRTNFRAVASGEWSDGSTFRGIEIGRCEVDIQ